MKALAIGIWKEWRDFRAVLLGVLGALGLLTLLAFLAFGARLASARGETLALLWLGVGALLLHLAVAAELWAGETRRGTLAVLQRLPHGVGRALLAKACFLLLAWVLVTGWQMATLALALRLAPVAGLPPLPMLEAGGPFLLCAWLGLVPLAFGLLASTWLGRGGGAALGAFVLLAAVGAPFLLLFSVHPWAVALFVAHPADVRALSGLLLGALAVAIVASVLLGHRHAQRPLKPFLVGAGVVGVLLAAGFAHARGRVDAYLNFDPASPGFVLLDARRDAGGRYLFLDVARRPPGDEGWGRSQRAPVRSWIVDTRTGARTTLPFAETGSFCDLPDSGVRGWPFGHRSLAPAEALVAYEAQDDELVAVHWIDARLGRVVRVLPPYVRDAVADELTRRALREASWVRDAEGRRLWPREGVIEREGDPWSAPERVRSIRPDFARFRPTAGGWVRWTPGRGDPRKAELRSWDDAHLLGHVDPFDAWSLVLSDRHLLRWKNERGRDAEGRGTHARTCVLHSFEAGVEPRPIEKEPGAVVGVVAAETVLVLTGPEHDRALALWRPRDDEVVALARAPALPAGVRSAGLWGTAADGSLLVGVSAEPEPGRSVFAWGQLPPGASALRVLWVGDQNSRGLPVALAPDGTLTLFHGDGRVLELRPQAGGAPEVRGLFP